jgi:hypothetical protein
MRKMQKLLNVKKIFALVSALIFILPGVLLSACKAKVIDTTEKYNYSLERESINVEYSGDIEHAYNLPKVISDDVDAEGNPRYTVDWQIQSMVTDSGAHSAVRTSGGKYTVDGKADGKPSDFSIAVVRQPTEDKGWQFSLVPLSDDGDKWATIVFVANINGTKKREKREFKVHMLDEGEAEFENLYSYRHKYLEPYEAGLAKRRVFGLYDLKDGKEVKSGDTVNLAWRYKKAIALNIELYDSFNKKVTMPDSIIDIEQLNNAQGVPSTLNLKFKAAGTRTLRVFGTSVFGEDGKPDFTKSSAAFEYKYEIRDAINCYNFDEIKFLEKAARLNYIPQERQAEFYNAAMAASYPKLLSKQFLTTEKNINGTDYMKINGKSVGTIFKEFEFWYPNYRYRDIVLRSDMQTWAEGTWFFGNVFGNGYQLDATPYSQNPARVYRNVHGNDWQSEVRGGVKQDVGVAHEGEQFREGFGWGDKYAFYMLSNNTTIDNAKLTGENIVKNGQVPLLNEYKVTCVLGTSTLSGGAWGFNQGQAWDRGAKKFRENQYVENIHIMNCVIEKGLVLVGANFAPDREKPIVVESCELRYAGFTGIFARGQDDNQVERQAQAGTGMGSEVKQYSEIGRVSKNVYNSGKNKIVGQTDLSCGNFVVSKNNVFYDICTAAMLASDDWSGTYYRVLGKNNVYYTWIDSLKFVFPIYKIPGGMDNLNITKIAMSELTRLMNDPAYEESKLVQGSGGYFINVPFISVDSFDKNFVASNVLKLDSEVFYDERDPGKSGDQYTQFVTTSVEAGDIGSVFAFSVCLIKNYDIMRTGTYAEQSLGSENLKAKISAVPKAAWTVSPFTTLTK